MRAAWRAMRDPQVSVGMWLTMLAGMAEGANHRALNLALVYGLGNLAWASGQAIAAVASGMLAQMTSDLVPYALLATACLATLLMLRFHGGAIQADQAQRA